MSELEKILLDGYVTLELYLENNPRPSRPCLRNLIRSTIKSHRDLWLKEREEVQS